MNKSQTAVFNAIDKAYQDDNIQAIPEVRDLLLDYAKQLDNNGNDAVIVSKLKKYIANYAMQHHNTLPKVLHDLYHALDADTHYGITDVTSFLIN